MWIKAQEIQTSRWRFPLLSLHEEAVYFLFVFILAEMLTRSETDRRQDRGRRKRQESRVDVNGEDPTSSSPRAGQSALSSPIFTDGSVDMGPPLHSGLTTRQRAPAWRTGVSRLTNTRLRVSTQWRKQPSSQCKAGVILKQSHVILISKLLQNSGKILV